MSPATPLSAALGRPSLAGTVIVASVVAGAVLCWQIGLASDRADRVGVEALVMYVLALGLAIWGIIHGASAAWRWMGWVGDRWLPERLARLVHWVIPLVVLAALIGLVWLWPPDVAGGGSHPVAAGLASSATSVLAIVGAITAFVYAIKGPRRHRDRSRRASGWLPQHELAQRSEAERWRQAWQNAILVTGQLRRRELPASCVPLDVMTRPGEQVFLDGGMEYARFYGTDVTYVHTRGLYLGSPLFVAAGLAGDAIGNAAARSRAHHEAAAQWRELQPVRVLLTNERLLVHAATGWLTFDHAAVASFHPEPSAWHFVVEYHGAEPLRLAGMMAPHAAALLASILRGPTLLDQHPAFAALRGELDASGS